MWRRFTRWLKKIFGKPQHSVVDLSTAVPRDKLLRQSRILLIDDERPELIDDLQSNGFAIDYKSDLKKNETDLIASGRYDLLILDFGSVGGEFGKDEGLSILRLSKRINPALVVLAYTSKALTSAHAEFYRLADNILNKDAGIAESFEKIEEALAKSHSMPILWPALLDGIGVLRGSEDDRKLQSMFMKAVGSKEDLTAYRSFVVSQFDTSKLGNVGELVLDKLFDIGLTATIGG